jgi:bifunctional non-homologous end joining protein LigD
MTTRLGTTFRLNGHEVRVSHPERVVFPDPPGPALTKADLVGYYAAVAPVMVPHLKGRPLMLQRVHGALSPTGDGDQLGPLFYQKEASSWFPEWIPRVTVPKRGGTVTHVICDDAATLVYLANQGMITPHPWLSRADQIDRPDRIVFDLDPSVEDLEAVRSAARSMGELVREVGLEPHLMATGSRGFHVVVPIRRELPFPAVHAICAGLADVLARRQPDRLTTEFMKVERGDRVFIDYHRNTYAQTAVPAYAIRPKAGAPVATPLAWDELDGARPDGWNVRTVVERVERGPDPWAGFSRRARSIDRARRWLAKVGR